jgi:hypothetical protein
MGFSSVESAYTYMKKIACMASDSHWWAFFTKLSYSLDIDRLMYYVVYKCQS